MTTLGAAVGPTIGNIEQYGFDMAFTAVFLVLLRGMWKGMRASRPWFVSLVVAAATQPCPAHGTSRPARARADRRAAVGAARCLISRISARSRRSC